MSEWTEETIRAAATWQAFKQGREIWRSGAVTGAAAGSSGWKGTVPVGGKPRRVSVTVKSATDIVTACGCPENRTTGALCAHGVAVSLAALQPKIPAVQAKPESFAGSARPAGKPEIVPRQVVFPPDWPTALSRGKLAVAIVPANSSAISPPDHKLHDWLIGHNVAAQATQLLLTGGDLEAFLAVITGHERVFSGKDRTPLEITEDARICTGDATADGENLVIRSANAGSWLMLGNSAWATEEGKLTRAGTRSLPASLVEVARQIVAGKTARIALKRAIESLAEWQDWLAFPQGGWLDALRIRLAKFSLRLVISGTLQRAKGELTVLYPGADPVSASGGEIENLPRLEGENFWIRDREGEIEQSVRLSSWGWKQQENGSFELTGEDSVTRFLFEGAAILRAEGWQVEETGSLRQLRQKLRSITPVFEVEESQGKNVRFDLSFQIQGGGEISLVDVRRLLRGGGGKKPDSSNRWLVLDGAVAEAFELLEELEVTQEKGQFTADLRAAAILKEFGKNTSKKKGEKYLCDNISPPLAIAVKFRPYQQTGYSWIVNRWEKFHGALLADDMGLGKTLQTIAAVERLFEINASGLVLVVAPVSILENWREEWRKFAPGRRIRVLRGSGRDQEKELVREGEVLLTSFGTLARDLAWYVAKEFRAVIVDEASLMRNPATDQAKAICKLRAEKRLALTGTPLENGIGDLWSIFRFIQPGWLGTKEIFRDRYELPLKEGDSKVLKRLKLKCSPFLLRRTKQEVASDLPSKQIIDEFCELSSAQRKVYQQLAEEGQRRMEDLSEAGQTGAARMQVLTTLLRLRQTCCDLALLGNDRLNQLSAEDRSGKLERLLTLLSGVLAEERKVLIFSQFQKQLLEIGKLLAVRNWDYLQLDGATRNRAELVARFQGKKGPPIFLISLKAGGYGLNLTAADTVIHFDPWWNPAAEAQATDRAHRIGQTKPVTVYRLLTRRTVEEQVIRFQDQKRALAAGIEEGGESDPGWSMDDLKRLIEKGDLSV